MIFDHPRYLWLLLLFVILLPDAVLRYRKCRKGAALFASAAPSGEREFLLGELRGRMILSNVFFLLFTAFLIIALAGPRWGVRIVPDYRRGVDVVLAFDLSRSMNVRDCPPSPGGRNQVPRNAAVSRLERGIGIARDLTRALGDIRVGAAVGKGRGILAVPLTYDSETVLAFIDSLDALGITGRGTNLESLIDAASGAFQDSIPSRRGIILFSDGEALSGSLQAGLEKIRAPGIILSVLGLGSDEGGPVPVEKSPDAPGGVLLDADGSPVISVRQGDSLRAAAEKSGGIFIDGSRNDAAAVLADYVNSLSAESGLSGHRREANPQWRIFVIAAMVCLGGARVMGFGRRNNPPKSGGRGKSGIQVLLCLAALLDSSCTRTQGKLLIMEGNFFYSRGFYTEAVSFYLRALDYGEAVPYAEYGLGAAYFALEEGNAALARYQAAEKGLFEHGGEAHSELRYRIYYNMGIIHFEQGDYTKAADAFREALKIDGSRIEAKRNLELSLLTVARTGVPPGLSPSPATDAGREGTGADNSVLFDYLRRKEQDQWKSREWSGEDDFSGPDY